MALDSSLYLANAIVATLKGAVVSGAPLAAGSIYAEQPPPNTKRPWLQYGQPIVVPFLAGCLDGNTVTFAVHAFTVTAGRGAQTITGAEKAQQLAAWVARTLGGPDENGLRLDLAALGDCPYPAVADLEWTGTQVFADSPTDADAFHGIATFSATIS